MRSLILQTATGYLLPLLILYAVFLFIQGHSAPGGGFIGGLVVASAVSLGVLAFGVSPMRRFLPLMPQQFIGLGLMAVFVASAWALFFGAPFLTASWVIVAQADGSEIAIGTPLLFDFGIFLAVIGAVLAIVLALIEEA